MVMGRPMKQLLTFPMFAIACMLSFHRPCYAAAPLEFEILGKVASGRRPPPGVNAAVAALAASDRIIPLPMDLRRVFSYPRFCSRG